MTKKSLRKNSQSMDSLAEIIKNIKLVDKNSNDLAEIFSSEQEEDQIEQEDSQSSVPTRKNINSENSIKKDLI